MMRSWPIIVWTILGSLLSAHSSACVKSALLGEADDTQKEQLLLVDQSCKKGIELLQTGYPLQALEQFKTLVTKSHLLSADIGLLIAEAMYQAGTPVDQTLLAWEAISDPAQLVEARRFELVQRLPLGAASGQKHGGKEERERLGPRHVQISTGN